MSSGFRAAQTALIVIGACLLVFACHRPERCATCGMKIDPASPWVSYVTIHGKEQPFDTPSCAFTAWRKAGTRGQGARFREYYSQEMKPDKELLFVRGSDVVGPMGPDLVPVAADTARRFARDHNGAPPQSAEELVRGEAP
jgi:copper chaperone NosL